MHLPHQNFHISTFIIFTHIQDEQSFSLFQRIVQRNGGKSYLAYLDRVTAVYPDCFSGHGADNRCGWDYGFSLQLSFKNSLLII